MAKNPSRKNLKSTDDPLGLVVVDQQWLDKPTTEVLAGFGAGQASPGSGSAAALMGLLASKLIITVCSKSVEKSKVVNDAKDFRYVTEQCQNHYESLRELFEKDASDFREVIELKKQRDKSEPSEEKSKLQRQANDLLEKTTDYVLEIIEKCRLLAEHGLTMFERGWPYVRGDSGAAISAAIGGIMSGIFIVNLNIKILKDRQYAKDNASKTQDLYAMIEKLQARAFSQVTSLNKEAIGAIQLELEAK
jgi:formiminotetrahydrofolate cyclodeaminase